MTRLYYDNAYLTEFKSEVLEYTELDGRPGVILAESAFYPTSGGQPNDTGTLNTYQVLDVIATDQGDVHLLDKVPEATEVEGKIDWPRRFDHMVHHTGQHILTRAFIETVGAETVGFHLSDNSVTIDLDSDDIPAIDVDAAEDLANQIISENRHVRAWFPSAAELADLQLRKISEKVTGAVRVVDIGGFDLTACGGTHVAQTGEVGLIKILRLDHKKGSLRVEFTCGARALTDYRQKNALIQQLSTQLTTGMTDIPSIVDKMRDENKSLQRELRTLRDELLSYRTETLWAQAAIRTPHVIVEAVMTDMDRSDMQRVASQLIQKPNTIALIGLAGDASHLVFARSEDVEVDVIPLLKAALATLGTDRGGGRPAMAQGGGVPADVEQVETALASAKLLLS